MRLGPKPVRRCYKCLLNLGDHCWIFECPRRQWNRKKCPGFENAELNLRFREWQEAPDVKTRKQLRKEIFRGRAVKLYIHRFRKKRGARSK